MIAIYLSQYDTIPNIRGLTLARIRGSIPSECNDINTNYEMHRLTDREG